MQFKRFRQVRIARNNSGMCFFVKAFFVFFQNSSRAPIMELEALHDSHQIIVTDSLQIPNGVHSGLHIGLRDDFLNQILTQFRNIGQFAPRPFQCRSKLRNEVAYSPFTSGNPVGFKQSHLRPAHSKTKTNRIIQLLGGGHIITDEPQSLAPNGLLQTVCNEGLYFFTQNQRFHPNFYIKFCCLLFGIFRSLYATTNFD